MAVKMFYRNRDHGSYTFHDAVAWEANGPVIDFINDKDMVVGSAPLDNIASVRMYDASSSAQNDPQN